MTTYRYIHTFDEVPVMIDGREKLAYGKVEISYDFTKNEGVFDYCGYSPMTMQLMDIETEEMTGKFTLTESSKAYGAIIDADHSWIMKCANADMEYVS